MTGVTSNVNGARGSYIVQTGDRIGRGAQSRMGSRDQRIEQTQNAVDNRSQESKLRIKKTVRRMYGQARRAQGLSGG